MRSAVRGGNVAIRIDDASGATVLDVRADGAREDVPVSNSSRSVAEVHPEQVRVRASLMLVEGLEPPLD